MARSARTLQISWRNTVAHHPTEDIERPLNRQIERSNLPRLPSLSGSTWRRGRGSLRPPLCPERTLPMFDLHRRSAGTRRRSLSIYLTGALLGAHLCYLPNRWRSSNGGGAAPVGLAPPPSAGRRATGVSARTNSPRGGPKTPRPPAPTPP